jgi:hypothetical protein
MVVAYCLSGFLISKYNVEHLAQWVIIGTLIRFGLYSPIWSKIAYNKWTYLGDKSWTDKVQKWLYFDVLKQGEDVILWINFMSFGISIMMYLNLV